MTKEARIYIEEKTVSAINGTGKTEQLHTKKKKNQPGLFSHTKHKSKFKMNLKT